VFASRELRTPARLAGVFLACLAACLSGYLLLGHRILTAAYLGKALPLVGRLTAGNSLSLMQYLARADEQVILLAVTVFLSFFFYLFLALVVRRLLTSDAGSAYLVSKSAAGVRTSEVTGAFLVYSLVTVAFFHSIIPHMASLLIGPSADNMQHLWDIWWARHALQGRLDFLHTTSIFWPEGYTLLFHPFSIYNLLVALTLGWPFSPVVVYNLLILCTFVLSGVGAFLLIRHLTDNKAAALLGGFIFAFNPSHFAHSLGQIEIASLQFIPFFVLFYLKTLEDGSTRNVVWASVFFLLNTLCSWYYMVFALLFMVACYGITAYRSKKLLMPGPILSSFVVVGATFVTVSPLTVRMLLYALRHPGVNTWGYDEYVVDLLGLLVPDRYHWLAGIPSIAQVNGSYSGFPWESVGYLGVVSVGFLLASGRMLVRRAARYVLGLLLFVVLSFGASFHFLGRAIPTVLPYAAIESIPILSDARAPGRTMAYAYLFLGVLVAIAFSYQLGDGFLRKRKWVAALLALGICADFWSPCRQTTVVRLPAAYSAILAQEQTKDFGILDLPCGSWSRRAKYMMYQTLHGIPIVQGYLTRKPSLSFVDTLEYRNLATQKEQLRSAHVKYIVIHKRIAARETEESYGVDLGRYAEEYQMFFEDLENLVLRVY
jgi:hypothetical protein